MNEVMEHVESRRLFELAQMAVSIDQPDWEHIQDCPECGAAFFMLSLIVRANSRESALFAMA
jgi:hypothetical protein